MLLDLYALLYAGYLSHPGGVKKSGRLNLQAQFRGVETEEQKRLRREAQGIIKRIQKAQPEQVVALQDEAEGIGKELQDAIARLELAADAYEQAMKAKQAQKARRDAEALQAMLIEAQLQTELLQQQAEELDVVWLTFAIAAHL